jgi:phosphotriesterase-related protein
MNLFNDITYAHEHTTIDLSGVKRDLDCRLDNFEDVLEEFRGLKELGVSRIIDQTNRGMGRNPQYVLEVAERTGLQILQGTGYYKEPFLPEECYRLREEELAEIMITEITQGGVWGLSPPVTGPGAAPLAFIGEIGTSGDSIHPVERKIFRAAARAHRETGVAVCTHTTLGTLGLEQVEIFREFDADLSKVVLSHIDLSADLDYMLRLLDLGVNIAFDTIGKENYQPDLMRVKCLAELCRRNYSDHIVMSVDITRKSHYRKNGGIGYAYLLETFVPMLMDAGCSHSDLEAMLVCNPARIYYAGERAIL